MLDLLDKLAKDEPAKFRQFTDAFGNVLKEGIAEDPANRERIAKLLRFCVDEIGKHRKDGFARRLRRSHAGGPGHDLVRHR